MGVQLAGGPVRTLTTFTGEVSHLWNPQTITVVTSQIIITNLALVKKFEVSPRSYQDMTQRQEVSKCCWKNAFFSQHRVATVCQFVKKAIALMYY